MNIVKIEQPSYFDSTLYYIDCEMGRKYVVRVFADKDCKRMHIGRIRLFNYDDVIELEDCNISIRTCLNRYEISKNHAEEIARRLDHHILSQKEYDAEAEWLRRSQEKYAPIQAAKTDIKLRFQAAQLKQELIEKDCEIN